MTQASSTLCIGTRKGLFTATRADSGHGWRIGAPHFPEPVTQFAADPADGAWYAALRLGHFGIKIRKSMDRGASWPEVAAPAFPPKPLDGPWKDDPTHPRASAFRWRRIRAIRNAPGSPPRIPTRSACLWTAAWSSTKRTTAPTASRRMVTACRSATPTT